MWRSKRREEATVDQLEGRNVVREALAAGDRVRRVLLDERAVPDAKLHEIESLARKRNAMVERVSRDLLDRMAEGRVHNGVIGLAEPLAAPALRDVLGAAYARGDEPLVVLLDEVQYEQNLGAVLRSADAAGASALVIPTRRGAGLSPVVQRIAMGAAEHVPVVREGILAALADLRRDGFRVVGAAEDGDRPCWEADLTGPVALVLGGEDKGITPTVRSRCDVVCRVPMRGHVPSLNVSATAAILMFERVRQTAQRDARKLAATRPAQAPAARPVAPPAPPAAPERPDLDAGPWESDEEQ